MTGQRSTLPEGTTIWFAAAVEQNAPGGVITNMDGFSRELRNRGYSTRIICCRPGENCFAFALRLALMLIITGGKRPAFILARSSDGILAALAARALGLHTRVVLHNHGWEEHSYAIERTLADNRLAPRTTFRARLMRFPLVRAAAGLAHASACGTIAEIRWARQNLPRTRQLYIPNGVSVSSSCAWTASRNVPDDFLCVGPHTWKKNLEQSVKVVAQVKNRRPPVRLLLVGCGTGALSDPGLYPGAWVTRLAGVPKEEMIHRYCSCPYLITSSRYEGGHPLSVLEAMAQGCIVFASDIAAHREIIRDGLNGFFLAGDIEKDAAKINAVLDDTDSMRIRIGARESARRHRWERQTSRLIHALERL